LLTTVPFGDLFTIHRNSDKWLFDVNGDLVKIPVSAIPYAYDPRLKTLEGIQIEGYSRNLFKHSDTLDDFVLSSGMSLTSSNTLMGASNALHMDSSVVDKTAKVVFDTPLDCEYIGVSYFVRTSDNSYPIIGRSYSRWAEMHLLINGQDVMDADSTYDIRGPLKDGSFWVRSRIRSPETPIVDFAFATSHENLKKDIWISTMQIEENLYSSLIPTNGAIEERLPDYITGALEYGRTMNKQQGTIDFMYEPHPGSKGTAFRLHTADLKEHIQIGRLDQPNNIKIDSENALFGFEDNSNLLQGESFIRFTYSPYGVRMDINQGTELREYKDFNMFELNTPNMITIGESTESSYFTGLIKLFRCYARAYVDTEMSNGAV